MKIAYIKRVPAQPNKWFIVSQKGTVVGEGNNYENPRKIAEEKGYTIKGEI